VRTSETLLDTKQDWIDPVLSQAMKVIRADLTAEGRLDILEKVMAYRGGLSIECFVVLLTLTQGMSRIYTPSKYFYPTQKPKYNRTQDRRRIEREAFSGQLLGIVATNALELGVDIGVLDVVIVLGFPPGGLASFVRRSALCIHTSLTTTQRQQIGRAGRRARDSLTVFVPEALPMDDHYSMDPKQLLQGAVADIILDLENPLILEVGTYGSMWYRL